MQIRDRQTDSHTHAYNFPLHTSMDTDFVLLSTKFCVRDTTVIQTTASTILEHFHCLIYTAHPHKTSISIVP